MTGIRRRSLIVAGGAAAALLTTGAPAFAGARRPEPGGELVTGWNAELLAAVRTPGTQPATVHPTRGFALMHLAVRDATVVCDRRASPAAAAAQAAHDVLAALFPSRAAVFAERLARDLAAGPDGTARARGIHNGQTTAAVVLHERATDGSSATPPAIPAGTRPGQWRPAPPSFAAAVFTHWPDVRPFALARASQFRPAPYPPQSDALIREVRLLGQDTSTARTVDQTEQAKFWAAPIWNYWFEIAQGLTTRHHLGVVPAAHVFARLATVLADTVIAFYDAKYHFRIWRPITAIRETSDPQWTPLAATPADPSYVGAHSAVGQAAATVLAATFGSRPELTVTSESLPGVTRTFRTLQAAADEAGRSRIFAGLHTRVDHQAGQELGLHVARYIRVS
ncbi:vanadium-dependent haloperoxidase [Dactylosporangium sp. NPDC051541]|uniref:vanadium-dependent haloperoxidase n=1 Tax=Dactylosporangium sp. NPDC051541 TaxID=3363977 RepID=UPI0037895822